MQGREGRLRHKRRFRSTSSGCLLPQQVARELLGIKETCHNGQVHRGRCVTPLGQGRVAMVNGTGEAFAPPQTTKPRRCLGFAIDLDSVPAAYAVALSSRRSE